MTEAALYNATGFDPARGTPGLLLGSALSDLDPRQSYKGDVTGDERQLGALLTWVPFLAMLDRHWVIVDGANEEGDVMVRDPQPRESHPHIGTEGTIARAAFLLAWRSGRNQIVLKFPVTGRRT